MNLLAQVSGLPRPILDQLRKEAAEQNLDFYVHVAAHVLGCKDEEVTTLERSESKAALFVYLYSRA